MAPRIGAHLSVGKGLVKTADQAKEMGLECLQIFVRNPRGAAARKLGADEVKKFRAEMTGQNISPVVVHIPYISNPASFKPDLFELAERIIREDLERCDLIGAQYLVLHPGSSSGSTLEDSLGRLAQLLDRVLADYHGETTILLETMAGQGSEIGKTFEELKQVFDQCKHSNRMGICFDTCHTFAAGYDIKSIEGLNQTADKITGLFGKDIIKVVHINDSLGSGGSRKDRHAPVGQGQLGVEGLQLVINYPLFNRLPFILETPAETLAADVESLKKLRV